MSKVKEEQEDMWQAYVAPESSGCKAIDTWDWSRWNGKLGVLNLKIPRN